MTASPKMPMRNLLTELLRVGSMSFGGPVALVNALERRFVARGWMSAPRFSEWLAICKLLPGPLATQMAIATGSELGGVAGGFIGGWVFLLPSFFLILVLSVGLEWFRNAPHLQDALKIFTALAFGLVVQSVLDLAKSYLKQPKSFALAAVAGGVVFWSPAAEPLVIVGLGILGSSFEPRPQTAGKSEWGQLFIRLGAALCGILLLGVLEAMMVHAGDMPNLAGLFWVLTKAGAWVYGSGLAILPVLQSRLVDQLHWLTPEQFLDGLMIGQVTPGPLVIAVVHYGWILFGWPGALVAMLGMFGPAFFNILVLVPWVWRVWSRSPFAKGFQAWALPAVVGAVVASSGNLALRLNFGLREWAATASVVFLLAAIRKLRAPDGRSHAA